MQATNRSESTTILRTTDLTLAAFLTVEGFDYDLVEDDGEEVKPGHPQGAWEFKETSTLRRVVEEYNNHEAQVEPRAFHSMVNQTRREMFSFLGIGNRKEQ